MAKTVDISERTLEEEKKEFALVCKVFEILCTVIVVVFAVIAIGVEGIMITMGAKLNDILVFSANIAVLLFGMVSALNFGRAIFKTLKSGDTPFRYDIADKVKGAALALLMCGFLGILILGISSSFSVAFSDICHYFFFMEIGCCVVGCLMGVMSYILNYGCKLQQESDETL